MKNKLLNKSLFALGTVVLLGGVLTLDSCSWAIYKIWDANRTNSIIKELEEEESKQNNGDSSSEVPTSTFTPETYINKGSSGDTTKYEIFTLYSDTEFTLDYYEAKGKEYIPQFSHLQGTYERTSNSVKVAINLGVYFTYENGTYNDHKMMTLDSSLDGNQTILDGYYTSVWGNDFNIGLKEDGTFKAGEAGSSNTATGSTSVKSYKWDDFGNRDTYRSLYLLDDGNYIVSTMSTDTKVDGRPAAAFMGISTYSYMDDLATDTYKVAHMTKGEQSITLYGAGSAATVQAFDYNLYDMMVDSSEYFYVSDTGFIYKEGTPAEEKYGAYSFYPYAYEEPEPEPDPEPEPESNTLFTLEQETSFAGYPITLAFNKDGTVVFAWSKYNVSVDGTWEYANDTITVTVSGYDVAYGTTTITEGTDGKKSYTFDANTMPTDGTLGIQVSSSQGLKGIFLLSADQIAKLGSIGGKALFTVEHPTSQGAPMTLTINKDGTYDFAWSVYASTASSGTWEYHGGTNLALTSGSAGVTFEYGTVDRTASTVFTAGTFKDDGSVGVHYNLGGKMHAYFEFTKENLEAMRAIGLLFTVEHPTSQGAPMTMSFYKDGTYHFEWSIYSTTASDGTWSYTGGTSLALTSNSAGVTFEYGTVDRNASTVFTAGTFKEDGTVGIHYNLGGQMHAYFEVTAAELTTLKEAQLLFTVEHPTSQGAPMTLSFYRGGTYHFEWSVYASTASDGTWSYTGGTNLALTSNSAGVTFEYGTVDRNASTVFTADVYKEDGTIGIHYNLNNQMHAYFEITPTELALLA